MVNYVKSFQAIIYFIFMALFIYIIDFVVMQSIVLTFFADGWLKVVMQFGLYFLYLIALIGVPLLMATQE